MLRSTHFLLVQVVTAVAMSAACSADIHSKDGRVDLPIIDFRCSVDFEGEGGETLASATRDGTLTDAGPLVLDFNREDFAVFAPEFAAWFAHFEAYSGSFALDGTRLTVTWRVRVPDEGGMHVGKNELWSDAGYEGSQRIEGPNGRDYVRRFECHPH